MRDERIVTIAAGIGVMLAVLAVGTALVLLADTVVGISDGVEAGMSCVIVISMLFGVAYVIRHRR